jgi:uncharacterized protein (TIGR03086 family)
MTQEPALVGGVGLLERALSYTLGSLNLVTPEALSRPTPCRDWDLRALLVHMNDSLAALHQAVDVGRVDLVPSEEDRAGDLVAVMRDRACRMIGSWTTADGGGAVSVHGCPLTTSIVTSTGALEITAHGWDVAQACGSPRPVPQLLAEELLSLAPLLVTDADRPVRFAPPQPVALGQGPAELLIAFLGRSPF